MNVNLRCETGSARVDVQEKDWRTCDIEELDKIIRVMQVARKWLADERKRKAPK